MNLIVNPFPPMNPIVHIPWCIVMTSILFSLTPQSIDIGLSQGCLCVRTTGGGGGKATSEGTSMYVPPHE